MKKAHLILLALLFISTSSFSQDYLHQDGQNIVDGQGKNVLLRGLGLGGWMLQEGYMLKTGDFAGPQHQIKQRITGLIGKENTERFYKEYRANGITKRDIDSLAAWGFNSIRLPMHYNLYTLPIEQEPVPGEQTWLEEGFTMTDNLLQWCADNNMYLFLDLHAAPGGQGNDANISDYDTLKPSLWESKANQDKMVALWKNLASRYKDSKWIGGYDIINEPNWNFTGSNPNGCDETLNAPLRELMVSVTQAIREVDKNHLIIIEGNCWGNNYSGIFPLWDDNMVLSFHKYWNYNDTASIQTFLDYRTKYNVPIWMGEGGENSNVWFRDAISLLESNNIGWNFWPMKKIDNIAGITSVPITREYKALLEYWQIGGKKPSESFSKKALMQIAKNYKMENLDIHYDVIDAMFRQVQTTDTKAFKNHSLPGIVYATHYDLGTQGHAYFDNDFINYRVSDGTFKQWNKGHSMRNDGVDIQPCYDKVTNGYMVGYTEAGEWLQYTIELDSERAFDVDIRYSADIGGGQLSLANGSEVISGVVTIPSTGGYNKWNVITIKGVHLNKGVNKLHLHVEKGNFNLNYMKFKPQVSKSGKK